VGLLNFGKKKAAVQFDPDLEGLTSDEAALLRRLFAELWPAAEGTITVFGDYAESSSGGQFGLYNLSRAVKLEPEQNWPQVVERHISGVLSRSSEPKDDDLSDDEIVSLVKARLIPSAYLPESHRGQFDYRRVIVNDLEAILMLDFPEAVNTVPDAIVSRFDADLLWQTAIGAVSAEPLAEMQTLDAGGGPFHLISSDSMFTASRALDIPSLLASTGSGSAPHGVLFAVPSRHHLAFHVIESPAAIQVVQGMFQVAQTAFGQGVGEISPHVFYWGSSGYEQVTSIGENDAVNIDGTGAFFGAINGF
jgi:hypothetical protein